MDTSNTANENIESDASVDENVDTVNQEAAEQKETDWKAEARKWEKYAKENLAFKTDAEKYREYVESQKTEYEKLQEAEAKARLELEQLRADSLKKDIVIEKNIPTELVEFLTGTTKEELDAQAEKILSVIANQTKPNAKVNPEQGKPNGNTTSDSLTDWVNSNLLNK